MSSKGCALKAKFSFPVQWKTALLLLLLVAKCLPAREKEAIHYGMGLIINVPLPDSEVTPVVQDVVQNGIIRGTKEYEKDEYISGATAVGSTKAFPEWTEGGKVFYKVRLKALDPRNFKTGNDVGTVAVRYVLQPQGEKNTVLRIDAVFVEDFRHAVHPSDGSVETAEYKVIRDHLDELEAMKAQTVEAERSKAEHNGEIRPALLSDESSSSNMNSASTEPPPAVAEVSPAAHDIAPAGNSPNPENLADRLRELRHQLQRLVKAPGAPLKSAPFHTASTLQSLPAGAEVLVVITTPYWLGVETHNGQHGWMKRDELEQLP